MASIDFRTAANRQADLPWLYELRADDLFARCRIADERRVLDVTTDYSAWLPFRVPPPREASNEDLDALKSFYVELLRDPARMFDDVLDGPATADDGRAVLLYALEYALLTRGARCEGGGLGAENFPLHLPCKRIATNGRLLRWCRDALRAPQDRRAALIISCVGLLRAGAGFLKKPRAAVEDFLGADGHETLWDDLVACMRHFDASTGRPNAFPAQATAEFMLFAIDVGNHLDVPTARESLIPARHRDFFADALERARPQLHASTYDALHDMVAPTAERLLELAARAQQEASGFKARDKATRRRICDGPNCSNTAPFKCNRCGLVSYCCARVPVPPLEAGPQTALPLDGRRRRGGRGGHRQGAHRAEPPPREAGQVAARKQRRLYAGRRRGKVHGHRLRQPHGRRVLQNATPQGGGWLSPVAVDDV